MLNWQVTTAAKYLLTMFLRLIHEKYNEYQARKWILSVKRF